MQTEDYVNQENKTLSGHAADKHVRESMRSSALAHVVCFNTDRDSSQRKLHRNPECLILTRSEQPSERENSGFSV